MPTQQGGMREFSKEEMDDILKAKSEPLGAPSTPRELTFGERAVGITFNPGGHPLVNALKEKAAIYIDALDAARNATDNGEVKAQITIAIRYAQTSQMWGVKAVTWQY